MSTRGSFSAKSLGHSQKRRVDTKTVVSTSPSGFWPSRTFVQHVSLLCQLQRLLTLPMVWGLTSPPLLNLAGLKGSTAKSRAAKRDLQELTLAGMSPSPAELEPSRGVARVHAILRIAAPRINSVSKWAAPCFQSNLKT